MSKPNCYHLELFTAMRVDTELYRVEYTIRGPQRCMDVTGESYTKDTAAKRREVEDSITRLNNTDLPVSRWVIYD